MIRKKVIVPHRVRMVSGSFAFIPHRFLSDGFLRSLSADELLLYFFLVLVADKDGVSYYGSRKICTLLKMGCPQYEDARDRLIARGLVAHDDTFFQVLELPDKPITDLPDKTGGYHA